MVGQQPLKLFILVRIQVPEYFLLVGQICEGIEGLSY